MIYLTSNAIDASSLAGVSQLSVEESKRMILSWPVVQFDTETTGLDPHVCELTSLQFGYKDFGSDESTQIVVDCRSIAPESYKGVIENSQLVGHNLKFDLQFLFKHGIVPLHVYDTMVCEQTLYLGYEPGRVPMGLASVLQRYTGIELDKSFQSQIAAKGLTHEGIIYAAADVEHLQDIRKSQILIAKGRKCLNAFTVENRFVPAIAYLEWCGVHLDVSRWTDKMSLDKKEVENYLKKLNEYVATNPKLSGKFVTFSQPSLFAAPDVSARIECEVNWDSSSQVVPVVQALGFSTKVTDKKTKEEKDSVEAKVLSTQKGVDDEFLDMYLGYKGAKKNVSSYGQGHINLINPDTGRLHTKFNQIGTVTGRMSSGGNSQNTDLALRKKMFAKDVKYVNMQNLPARGEYGKMARACFTAMEGYDFVSCDYSAEESRVQADVWNEKALLDSFANGIDTHNLYAKLCFPEELKDVDVKDVKKVRPDLRQAAKSAEFAIGYGSDGTAIAKSIGMSVEKAREMVSGILRGMPGMADYKKRTVRFLKKHGYIVINEITGHRVHWPEWSQWKMADETMDEVFWNSYWSHHAGTGDSVCEKVRKHRAQGHDWFEKNVLNYPIQGGSAIVLKQAAADLFEWVVKKGYFGKILFCVFVHDEIDCECPEELTPMFSKKLEAIMEKAATKYYKRLKIPAECSVGKHWIH